MFSTWSIKVGDWYNNEAHEYSFSEASFTKSNISLENERKMGKHTKNKPSKKILKTANLGADEIDGYEDDEEKRGLMYRSDDSSDKRRKKTPNKGSLPKRTKSERKELKK